MYSFKLYFLFFFQKHIGLQENFFQSLNGGEQCMLQLCVSSSKALDPVRNSTVIQQSFDRLTLSVYHRWSKIAVLFTYYPHVDTSSAAMMEISCFLAEGERQLFLSYSSRMVDPFGCCCRILPVSKIPCKVGQKYLTEDSHTTCTSFLSRTVNQCHISFSNN